MQSVLFEYRLDCQYTGQPPVYRMWVNDELFTERTWIWTDCYLDQEAVIVAPPGDYTITHELIGSGTLSAQNPQVLEGPGHFVSNTVLRIQ